MSVATDKRYSNCPLKKRPIQVVVDHESVIEEEPIDLSATKKFDRLSVVYSVDSGYGNELSLDCRSSQHFNYAQLSHRSDISYRRDAESPASFREGSYSPPATSSLFLEYNQNYNYHGILLNHNNNVVKPEHHQKGQMMISPGSSKMSCGSNQSDYARYSEPEDLSAKSEKKVLVLTDSSANIQRPTKELNDRSGNDLYYQCHSCSKCYSTHAGLMKHQQCHAIPQDLSKSKCDQIDSIVLRSDRGSVSKTTRHVTDNTSINKLNSAPRYQCPDCGKSYSTYSGLTKHQQFHCPAAEGNQIKKFFSCKNCDKVYVSLGALKMHIRTHTLPCKCPLCGKAFSRPWLLQGHIRTHTGEKPFSCQHCHRAFADRSNLRAHLQTHSDVKKYSCSSCSKTFSRMSLLGKHLQGGCSGNPVNQHNSSSFKIDYAEQSYYKPASYSAIGQSDYEIRRDYSPTDQHYTDIVY